MNGMEFRNIVWLFGLVGFCLIVGAGVFGYLYNENACGGLCEEKGMEYHRIHESYCVCVDDNDEPHEFVNRDKVRLFRLR